MQVSKKQLDELSYKIIGCAIEVHKLLGPGLLESVYEKCLKNSYRFNHLSLNHKF